VVEWDTVLKEFRNFILKGNVLELAIAFILGAAFSTIVQSMVNDIIMPPIGILLGNTDFTDFFVVLKDGKTAGPYASIVEAKAAGAVTWNYGKFITAVITFLIVAAALFMLFRAAQRVQKMGEKEKPAAAPTTKSCPHCFSTINIKATRCAHCTATVSA